MAKLTVLMYHKVSENTQDFLTVTSLQLQQQITWLKTRYNYVKLSDVIAHIETQKPMPPNALLITFDDGYENNYTLAYPIFKAHNIPFAIFLVGNFINKKLEYDGQVQSFLSISQLIEMEDIVEFGYHSVSHQNLMAIPENDWQKEIENGVNSFAHLPITIQNTWAYTYGSFPKKNEQLFKKLTTYFIAQNIACAFRIGNRKNHLPIKNSYALQRIDIRGNESFLKFKLKLKFGKLF